MAGVGTIPFSVDGKVALITGAGSGINFCFASLLLSRGCSVLIADLALRPEAEQLVQDYSDTSGTKPRAVFQKTDVTDWKQLEQAFDACIREFGGVDVVGPGAGVFEPPFSNFWIPPGSQGAKDATDANSYKTLDINVTHPIRATQMAIAEFMTPRDAKRGKASPSNPKRVVLTSSIAGQVFGLPTPMYFASKHAMDGFTRSLGSLDQTLGIRVNAVAPGVVKTPLWTDHPEKLRWVDEEADLWVTPEEVAEQMLRLLEDEELVGGSILEVGRNTSRLVPAFMNPGPQGVGHQTSKAKDEAANIFASLSQDGWGKGK